MAKGIIGTGKSIFDFVPQDQVVVPDIMRGTDEILGGTIGSGVGIDQIVKQRIEQAPQGRPVSIAQPTQRPTPPQRDRSAVYQDIARRQQMQLSPMARRPMVSPDETRRQQSQLNMISGVPTPQQQPRRTDVLRHLYADPLSAKGQALQAAAAQGLALSGYHDKPITTGQVLGSMMQAGREAYLQQTAAEAQARKDADLLALKRMEVEASLGKPLSQAGRAAVDAGLRPGTKEYQDFIKKFGQEEGALDPYEEALVGKQAGEIVEATKAANEKAPIANQYKNVEDQSLDLLKRGVDIGRVQGFLQPVMEVFRDLNLLTKSQADAVSDKQSLNAAFKVIVPQMRVEGSGATSNFEMKFYEEASPNFNNSHETNIIMAASARQSVEYEQQIAAVRNEYFANREYITASEAGRILEERGITQFKTPLGQGIQDATFEEVEAEMIKMVNDGRIKAGDVVYMGDFASKDGQGIVRGSFEYMTDEYISALMQE